MITNYLLGSLDVCVTEDDIKRGKRADAQCCPVALAVQRLLPPHHKAVVATHHIYIDRYQPTTNRTVGNRLRFELPPEVGIAIDNYDRFGTMEPRDFVVTERDD